MSVAADSMRWYLVCSMLEQLPTFKRGERHGRLKKLFAAHRAFDPDVAAGRATVPSGKHMYSLVRLLLPQLDRDEQGTNVLYNMKEVGIARVFIEALNLKGTQSEARLKAWKKPEGGEGYGHFAVVLYHQLTQPGRSHHSGKLLTVADVNEFIDGMAAVAGNSEMQRKLVTALTKKASANELKWIAKVLLRELRASATEELVYRAYHPDASELFKVDGRMREVVEKCRDPDKRIGDACIEVGKPFNPMLAEKTQDLEKITKAFKQKIFWIEPKLDGERMVIHMEDGVFKCFTRKHNEYTSLYGPILDKIKPFVKAKTCILDGEILGWSRATDRWVPFGNNVSLALKAGGSLPGGRHSDPDADHRYKTDETLQQADLCVVLFDVVRIGDERLENLPLASRRKRLHDLIDTRALAAAGHVKLLEIIKYREATKVDEVKDELVNQLHKDEEGVLIKNPDSVYKANARDGGGWFKLKPEYIFGGTQDYDVLIIGGSHGKNNRSGSMWTWVCGIAVKPPPGQKYPSEFISFSRIGTGLKHHEFRELDKLMRPHKRAYDQKLYVKGEPPKKDGDMKIERSERGVAVTFSEQRINGEKLPAVTVWFSGNAQEEVEVVFDPRKSVVLELTADYRLTDGGVWMAGRQNGEKRGWTLRFPRVKPKGIRLNQLGGTDKPWHDVMTTEEFDDCIRRTKEGGEGLANSTQMKEALGKGGKTLFQARKKGGNVSRGGPAKVDDRFQAFDPSTTSVTSDALNGCIVCVLPAAPGADGVKARNEVQTAAHELGAAQVVHCDEFTTHIIAMCKDNQKIRNLKAEDKDIIEDIWIHECYENKRLVPLEPRHMLHISRKRQEEFGRLYDVYEDSFTRDLTADELRKKLGKKKLWEEMEDDSEGELSDGAKCELEDELLDSLMQSEQGLKAAAAPESQAGLG